MELEIVSALSGGPLRTMDLLRKIYGRDGYYNSTLYQRLLCELKALKTQGKLQQHTGGGASGYIWSLPNRAPTLISRQDQNRTLCALQALINPIPTPTPTPTPKTSETPKSRNDIREVVRKTLALKAVGFSDDKVEQLIAELYPM